MTSARSTMASARSFLYWLLPAALSCLFWATGVAHAAPAYALKCYSADGSKQFPPVDPPYVYKTNADQNVFYALIRVLGITREQYEQWGVKCDQIMGINDPRPYTRELRDMEFRKENAACLPPDNVRTQNYGSVLHKVANNCGERLDDTELQFLIGVMSIGIEDCGFSPEAGRLPSYVGTMTRIMFKTVPVHMVPGQQYAKNLGCSGPLKQLTANGASYFRTH